MNIANYRKKLISEGKVRDIGEWQSTEINVKMVDIRNIFDEFECPNTIDELAKITEPQLPWAEDHFQERIGGEALNPGNQWKHWPFYQASKDDDRFRSNEGVLFDHTYMERFWPTPKAGIRYRLGS